MTLFLETLWFLLPAACANMAPSATHRLLPRFNYPLDGKKTIRGKRIFGDHKTVRGFIIGVLAGWLVFFLQQQLYTAYSPVKNISIFDYSLVSSVVGVLFGFGALTGDLVKSFFKRRLNIAPGRPWIPFDYIDWVLGTFVFLLPIVAIPIKIIVFALIVIPLLHPLIKYIGFHLGLDTAWR